MKQEWFEMVNAREEVSYGKMGTMVTSREPGKDGRADTGRRSRGAEEKVLDPAQAEDWPEFLTVGEVAQILRVHQSTVRKRIADGVIPTVRWTGSSAQRVSKRALLDHLNRPE